LEGRIVENLHRKLSKGSLIEMQNEYNSLEPTTYLSSSILASLSNRLVRESKTKEAIDVLTFAVNKYPKNWRFHQSLGDLLSRNGDRELAKQTYKKSLEINPNNLRAEVAISQLE
jgi:Flp pilus assembly protein TadD